MTSQWDGSQPYSQDSSSPASPDSQGNPRTERGLSFLKSLTERRSPKDTDTPKRRGPKPDSKPALTRRQELNRQAQRTHRERKELYVKSLEEEVHRLKDVYGKVSQDKDILLEENQLLKGVLSRSGIGYPQDERFDERDMSNSVVGAQMMGGHHEDAFGNSHQVTMSSGSNSHTSNLPPSTIMLPNQQYTSPMFYQSPGMPQSLNSNNNNNDLDNDQGTMGFASPYDHPSAKAYMPNPSR